MTSPLNQPEHERSAARQEIDGKITRKYHHLKWYQRSVGAACLLLGAIGGYLDNKQIAANDVDVPFTIASIPLVVAGSLSARIGRRITGISCDRLITDYAAANKVAVTFKNFSTELEMREDTPILRRSYDPKAREGDTYDDSHSKAIRLMAPLKDTCAYIGGFGLNGFTGNFHMPSEFATLAGPLGVAGVGTGAIFQIFEEASIGAHLRGYEAQLDNIDDMAVFRMPPPSPA